MRSKVLILLILGLTITSIAVPICSANGDPGYIHIQQMTLRFEGQDALVTLSYDLNFFADMYVFILGSHNLEPTFENMFTGFEDFETKEIGRDKAIIKLNNVSRNVDQYYLHDSRELGMNVGMLTVIYPDGSSKSYPNSDSTPNIFYS